MTEQADDRTTDEAGDAAGRVVESLSADEAFGLLGDETRLRVLRVLFEAEGSMTFSALREAVGVRDSGQFNYHLDRLVGTFVDRDDDGYGITTAGAQLVGAVLAGQYTKTVESDPVEVGAACPDCGTSLQGVFDGGYGRVRCEHCDRCIISLPVPPGVFEDYPREEWPFVAERWARTQVERAEAGFCPVCNGPMTSRLETDFERIETFDIPDAFAAVELFECERCGETMYTNAEASAVTHPAVVAFHHDHGVDVTTTPIWELDWAIRPRSEVVDEAPLRVEFTVELEDEVLAVVLDEGGNVVETRRSDGTGSTGFRERSRSSESRGGVE